MRKLAVYHPPSVNQEEGLTEFFGRDLEYNVDSLGFLAVTGWENGTHYGSAIFAPGQWYYARFYIDATG